MKVPSGSVLHRNRRVGEPVFQTSSIVRHAPTNERHRPVLCRHSRPVGGSGVVVGRARVGAGVGCAGTEEPLIRGSLESSMWWNR